MTTGKADLKLLFLQTSGQEFDEYLCPCWQNPRGRPHRMYRYGWGLEAREQQLDLTPVDQRSNLPERPNGNTETQYRRCVRRVRSAGSNPTRDLDGPHPSFHLERPVIAEAGRCADDALVLLEVVGTSRPAVPGEIAGGRRRRAANLPIVWP